MRAVLLPGLDGTGDLFQELVAHAPAGIETQIVAYLPEEPLGYKACTRHVLRELDSGSPFVLLAESFSGPVAVAVAQERPVGLCGLVLCNTFVSNPAWSGYRFLPWKLLCGFPIPRLIVRHFLTGPEHAACFLEPIRAANQKVRPSVLATRMREVLTVDLRAIFGSLPFPVLYLRGAQDNLIGPQSLAKAMLCKPDMTVAELPGPHLLLQVEPEKCWSEIANFISANCAAF
jgi:pimeloyl-ACP methyl ester carboxylesterase